MRRAIPCVLLLLLLAAQGRAVEPLRLTHGIASGDVTAPTAVRAQAVEDDLAREVVGSVHRRPGLAGGRPADGGHRDLLHVRLRNGERRRLVGKPKTILGAAQREWLLRGLREAEARGVIWKIVSTDDPLSIPTGSDQVFAPDGPMTPLYHVRDGWAAGPRFGTDTDGNQGNPLGFESELRAILTALKAAGIRNLVWLATDVHHAQFFRYEPGGELARLVFHEFIAGPVSAYTLPAGPLSRRFGPIELYARGRRPDPARPSFFNFGYLWIAADGRLTVEIRDAAGAVVPDDCGRPGALTLTPAR